MNGYNMTTLLGEIVMELRDFVKESLVQIVSGALAARDEIRALGGDVNPVCGHFDQRVEDGKRLGFERRASEMVTFDVALTEHRSADATGGIGVLLACLDLGAKGDSAVPHSSLSRIQFRIPILLPCGNDLRGGSDDDAPITPGSA